MKKYTKEEAKIRAEICRQKRLSKLTEEEKLEINRRRREKSKILRNKNAKKSLYKIYKFTYNDIVQYVGRTILTLKERRYSGYGNNTELFKTFNMELIEETYDKTREKYWIQYYRKINPDLYNKQDILTDLEIMEYGNNYYKNNREYCLAKQLEYKSKNADKMKEYRRNYYIEYRRIKKEKKAGI